MEKLKPCPFCGADNANLRVSDNRITRFVSCESCKAHGTEHLYDDEAIEAWNKRAELALNIPENHLIVPVPNTMTNAVRDDRGRITNIFEIAKEYAKHLEQEENDLFLSASLKYAGYVKERTCKPEYWNNGFGVASTRGECSDCGGYLLENLSTHKPLSYCPHCGARVVE